MLVTLNKQPLHRHGAEAARRAHNPEVTRSKRVAGILHFGSFTEAVTLSPVWRRGQRAGLITLRSGVQITSPVLLQFTSFAEAGRQC